MPEQKPISMTYEQIERLPLIQVLRAKITHLRLSVMDSDIGMADRIEAFIQRIHEILEIPVQKELF